MLGVILGELLERLGEASPFLVGSFRGPLWEFVFCYNVGHMWRGYEPVFTPLNGLKTHTHTHTHTRTHKNRTL